MKKELAIIILILLIAPLILSVNAQEVPPEAQLAIGLGQKAQDINQKIEGSQSPGDYLSQEFKKVMLQNPKLAKMNDWLEKNSLVFKIIFAQPFSVTLEFLIVIILWVYFMKEIYSVTKSAFEMKKIYLVLSAILATIILAQIGLYRGIAYLIEYLVFKPEALIVRLIVAAIIAAVLLLISYLNKKLSGNLEGKKEAKKAQETESDRMIIKRTAEGLQKGMKALDK
ncbi:MAG: hypothetical protein AABW73_04925 [Nanoarchaeota archaeon]